MNNIKKILKTIFKVIPYKKRIYLLIKSLIGIPIFYKHLYFVGDFEVNYKGIFKFKMMHWGTVFENDIFWKGIEGSWEPITLKYWNHYAKNANIILDIGANTGVFSLIAKACNPKSEVHAFEPIDRIRKKLQTNIKLNNFNIHVHNEAVSNYTGTSTFYDSEKEYFRQGSLSSSHSNNNSIQIKVPVITLKVFKDRENLQRIDLIKIDVESYEAEVIKGYEEDIYIDKPTIFIEVLDRIVANKVNKLIFKYNYKYIYYIDEEKGLEIVKKITTSKFRNYIITNKELK